MKAARWLGRWPPVPLARCHRPLLEAGASDVCQTPTFALGVRWAPCRRRLSCAGSRIQVAPRSPACHLSVVVCGPSRPSGRMNEVPVMAHPRIKRRNHMWRRHSGLLCLAGGGLSECSSQPAVSHRENSCCVGVSQTGRRASL